MQQVFRRVVAELETLTQQIWLNTCINIMEKYKEFINSTGAKKKMVLH